MTHCTTTDEHRDEVDADREEAIRKAAGLAEFIANMGRGDFEEVQTRWDALIFVQRARRAGVSVHEMSMAMIRLVNERKVTG